MWQWNDLPYALRLLRRSPLFTLLSVVVPSGDLGLSLFTLSFLHTAMFKPLPLGEGDRIVRISQVTAGSTGGIDAAAAQAAFSPRLTLATIRGRVHPLVDLWKPF